MIPEQRLRDLAAVEPMAGDHVVRERWTLATELLAARAELAKVNGEWAEQIAAALCSTTRSCGSTPADLAGHVRREHEAHTACANRLIKARNDLDAARAENERLAKQRDAMDRKRQALADACTEAVDWLARRASIPSCECDPSDLTKRMLAAIEAAEQPKPAGGGA